MYQISLFTGAMGGDLATVHLLGWRPVLYCEIDRYCQYLIRQRIKDGFMPDAPIWGDIRTLSGRILKPYRRLAEEHPVVITAGFPCQPFSRAGKGRAGEDDRNLWPETIRVIREVRPGYVFLENVPGLLSATHGYFGTILADLAESGYDARWCVLSAADAGAPHLRKRLWVLAYTSGESAEMESRDDGSGRQAWKAPRTLETEVLQEGEGNTNYARARTDSKDAAEAPAIGEVTSEQQGQRDGSFKGDSTLPNPPEFGLWGEHVPRIREEAERGCKALADTDQQGSQRHRRLDSEGECSCSRTPWACCPTHEDERLAKSGIRRISNGISARVAKLRAAGNAQVPEVAKTAWDLLAGTWLRSTTHD